MSHSKLIPLCRAAAALLALLLLLTGCGGGSGSASLGEDVYAQSLYASRVTSFSDTAGIDSLLAQMGVSDRMGTYTLETSAKEEPYTLILHFEQAPEEPKVFGDQFEYYAVLLLALVDSCGQVRCTYPSGSDTRSLEWTIQQANDHLNVNVPNCGKSAEGIAALLDTIHSTHGNNRNFAAFFEEE